MSGCLNKSEVKFEVKKIEDKHSSLYDHEGHNIQPHFTFQKYI